MQPGTLVGGAWNKAASKANSVSAFKVTGIFVLHQNSLPNHFFSTCNAADANKATEPVCSRSPINNSPESNSLTNSGALRHTRHLKTSLTLSKVLRRIRQVAHVPVKETEEHQATVDCRLADLHSCADCWENCYATRRKDCWIDSLKYPRWHHENCSVHANKSTDCGRQAVREKNLKI
jgi:hypothetical protein